MQYLVVGLDADAVGEQLEQLAESHWSYMDRYADQLVARGPLLSADGTEHTGSVHVLEAASLDDARQFAFQEPYCLAGLYRSVTVAPFQNALGGTMWDRPAPGGASSLVLATWPPRVVDGSIIAAQGQLVFGGLLLTDDATSSVGLAVALDTDPEQAAGVVAGWDVPATSTVVHRWRRGGRQQ